MKVLLNNSIVGCVFLLAASFANAQKQTQEKIDFLNFSEDPVDVFWVDTDNGNALSSPLSIRPHDHYEQITWSGHKFMYKWKDADTFAHVRSMTEPDVDPSSILPQVHILGGMDQPETRKVICETTKGDININIKPFWSPRGALRFLQLVSELRYFDGCVLNRVVPEFLTQFGIGADFDQRSLLREDDKTIRDDPHLDPPIHFRPGTMSYAGRGENTRSDEVFVVMPDTPQSQLEFFGKENSWETPFGYVEPEDLDVVGSWYSYGDMPPYGDGPDPQRIYDQDGYEYLEEHFPDIDYINGCAIVPIDDLNNHEVTGMSYEELAHYIYDDVEDEL